MQALIVPCYRREDGLLAIDRPQVSRLTEDEIDDRFEDCMAKFWSGWRLPSVTQRPYGDAIPSLVEVSKQSSATMFDLLFDAGTDASFWKVTAQEIPVPATPYNLAIGIPIHATLWSRNDQILFHLLSIGFNSNTMPLAAPTWCVSPLIATIVYCGLGIVVHIRNCSYTPI